MEIVKVDVLDGCGEIEAAVCGPMGATRLRKFARSSKEAFQMLGDIQRLANKSVGDASVAESALYEIIKMTAELV